MLNFMEKMICVLAVKCVFVLILGVSFTIYAFLFDTSTEDMITIIYICLGSCIYLICFFIYISSEGVMHYVSGFLCGSTFLFLFLSILYVVIVAFIHVGWEVFLYL